MQVVGIALLYLVWHFPSLIVVYMASTIRREWLMQLLIC